MKLYKYISDLACLKSIFENGVLASNPRYFNDPYEYEGYCNIDDFRVSCFTSSFNKKSFWTFYADGHRGCSIQIEIEDEYISNNDFFGVVRYESIACRKNGNISKRDLFYKDKKWKDEKERRAILNIKETIDSNIWTICTDNSKNKKYYLKCKICAIYLGAASLYDKEDGTKYSEALCAIEKFNNGKAKKDSIKVKKFCLSDTRYRIVIDKDFDIKKEIRRYKNKKMRKEEIS